MGTIIQLAMLRGRGEWIYCIAIPEGGERHTSLFSGLLCSFSRSSRSMPVRLFGSYLALKILSKDSKYSSLTLLTRSIWNPKTLFELQNRYLPQHHNVRWVCHCVAGHMKITEKICFGKSPPPRPTMGENHSFWLLKRFLIFQGISGDLDANLLKHISLKIQ